MKINFGAEMLDLEGKPLQEGGKALTLGSVCCTVLTMVTPDSQNESGESKVKKFSLAMLAVTNQEQEITPEQFTELKGLIGKAYGPIVVARAWAILDEAVKPGV